MSEDVLTVLDLGRMEYDRAWELQRKLHGRVAAGPEPPEHLLLVEHPPVITLGRSADRSNVLFPPAALERRGILLREVDRGGDVTYHGPGQLVAYPILRLRGRRRDVHGYFRRLEQVVIDLLAGYGIEAGREHGLTGVWVGDAKICAMGVAIKRWTTYHGLALNVNTNLDDFRLITPCGIVGRDVTSMQRVLGREVPLAEVAERLVARFAAEFKFAHVIRRNAPPEAEASSSGGAAPR